MQEKVDICISRSKILESHFMIGEKMIFVTAIKILIAGFLGYIARTDALEQKIYNRHLKCLGVLTGGYVLVTEHGNLGDKIIGILIISMPMLFIVCLWPGSFGGGDIKLMAICGCLLGWRDILEAFCIAMISAAVYAFYLLSTGKGKKTEFPLGPFLCFGILSVFLKIF